jgi:hypothetical protein
MTASLATCHVCRLIEQGVPDDLSLQDVARTSQTGAFVTADSLLDMPALLDTFVAFWLEYAEELLEDQVYPEVAPHLILTAFLQRIVNSGGFIDREYAIGRRRMALEIKVWRQRRGDPLHQGLEQLGGYLKSMGLDHGTLVIFDCRPNAPVFDQRYERSRVEVEGRQIIVLRL